MHHTAPCGIPQLYTDGRGASERHRHAEQYQVGKEHTQNMESKVCFRQARVNLDFPWPTVIHMQAT